MSAHRPLNVLIAGAGVAGLEALLALRRLAEERVAITLISPAERFVYRASIVPALFGRGVVEEFDLGELVAGVGGALVRAAVRSVDTDNRTIDLDTGDRYPYEALVVATGAQQREAVTGATTLRGDGAAVREVIDDVDRRQGGRIAFVVPAGTSWPMPLYELALFTAARAAGLGHADLEVVVVTPEERPLAVFGRTASDALTSLFEGRGIRIISHGTAIRFEDGLLTLTSSRRIATDWVVALPRLCGLPIGGIDADANGFIRTDAFGKVGSLADVYAAGDVTAFPVKQGGLATQQADVVAAVISADAGASVDASPFRPVLRGRLVTGPESWFIRGELSGGAGETAEVSTTALWWPPAKIAGRYLGPYLAERSGKPLDQPPAGLAIQERLPTS